MKGREPSLQDRLGEQAKAKRALLEKARASAPQNDPNFAERQEERRRIAEAREARAAEREAARQAEEARKAEERAAAEQARLAAIEAEKAEKEAERQRQLEHDIERKAIRDARYAARKARGRR
ncbi:FKBP-type peptidyl-prolyl cis-trans isomerase [Constrictibacter sp. MBR-5]